MGLIQNADGWTIITPTPDSSFSTWSAQFGSGYTGSASRIIFVASPASSSPVGSDSNAGTLAAPVATIAHALSLVRAAHPDHVLFRNGDTWTDETFDDTSGIYGVSATEPLVFASYDKNASNNPPVPNPGTGGARPLFKTNTSDRGIANCNGLLAILGLEFYCYKRDPGNPSYSATPALQVGIEGGPFAHDLLIEDCKVSYYTQNIELQCHPFVYPGAGVNMQVRRCIIVNAYDTTGSVSVGLGSSRCTPNHLVEENLFDTNGWNPALGLDGSSLNHNLYLSAANTLNPSSDAYAISDLLLKGNISTNERWQSQIRCGGYIYNNLFVTGEQNTANYGLSNPAANNRIDSNVFFGVSGGYSGNYLSSGAKGNPNFDDNAYWNLATCLITNNIFTQGAAASDHVLEFGIVADPAHGLPAAPGAMDNLFTLTNNIVWKTSGTLVVALEGDIYITTGYNVVDTAGANSGSSPEPFPFPNRTISTYYDSVFGGSGHTMQDFVNAAKLQSKGNWEPLLMAESVDDYIRQGFGVAMVGSAYADLFGGVTGSGTTVTQGYGVYKSRPVKMPHA